MQQIRTCHLIVRLNCHSEHLRQTFSLSSPRRDFPSGFEDFSRKDAKLKIRLPSFLCGFAPLRLCEKLWFTFHSWLRPRPRCATSVLSEKCQRKPLTTELSMRGAHHRT